MKNWMDISEEGIELLMVKGLVSNTLFLGRLMAPKGDDAATRSGPVAPQVPKAWCLCGNVPQDLLAAADKHGVQQAATWVRRANGLNVLVFAQRVGEWQHRLVLPLVGDEVRAFLRCAQEQPVRLCLADGHRRLTVLHEGSEPLSDVVADASSVIDVPEDIQPLVKDVTRVAVQALMPGFMPALDSADVDHTCVSYVFPPSLLAAMAQRTPRASGLAPL